MLSVVHSKCIALVAMVVMLASAPLFAEESRWPAEMTVAGFNITRISGNGSTASGEIQIPGLGGRSIVLNRSGSGDVTGSGTISGKAGGVDIQGSFQLNSSGINVRQGAIKCPPKNISDASFTIDSGGRISGNGSFRLNNTEIPARFSISGGSLSIEGSSPARAQAETQLASYEFIATLQLGANSGRVVISANGTVRRNGKLADQTTNLEVSGIAVDAATGVSTVNVGGVSISFSFGKS